MGRKSERGEGKLGGFILLVVVVAAGLAAWNVVPVYYDHYDFVDKVNEICRTPPYKARQGDESIKKMLMDEVSKRRLGTWIGPESFLITSSPTARQIELYYEREVDVLPGFKKVFKFDFKSDQPLI
ncbi:MAG TPA: hypothetical protein VIJ10_15625 [Vicinamibacteria bacterium]|jgi:hypothetical protein